MSEHTKGSLRLHVNGDACSYALIDEAGSWWMSVRMNGEQMSEQQEENLRRLVACWNACAGLTTEFLEAQDLSFAPAHTAAKMTEIELERDHLLAALKKSRLALAAASSRSPELKADYEAADKAIAAAEQQ